MMLTIDSARWIGAGALCAAYAGMCYALWRARGRTPRAQPANDASSWLVVYASQTGSSEYLAERTAATLALGGLTAQAACISTLDRARLGRATRILFICSTYGEGDAPDSAARFAGELMGSDLDLRHLHYAVLALGDASYANYCGFGRALDAWLAERGATALFERIDVDRGNAEALASWQHQLSRLAGTSDTPDWEAPAYGQWRIARREQLNCGSAGAPLFRIALVPADGSAAPSWEAGDLVQVSAPADPAHPREYSIASVPAEGVLTLLVRQQTRADGTPGACSGWLCTGAPPDATIDLRIRAHARFRLGENATRSLIAIGNGSGLAGLRALIKARIDTGQQRNWLVFGERSRAHDFLCGDELQQWHARGDLARLDLAFSRDGGEIRYVQHVLLAQDELLRAWVRDGAAIYVCGSLEGMAGGVHEALNAILGEEQVAQMMADGRYRRDVY